MTQDITKIVIDRRIPVFINTDTFSLLVKKVSNHNPTRYDYMNCPVCGVYYCKIAFNQCSSFCNSVSLKSDLFAVGGTRFENKTFESTYTYDWLVFEANRVRIGVRVLKASMRSMDSIEYTAAVPKLVKWDKTVNHLIVMAEISLLPATSDQDLSVLDTDAYLIEVSV